jgi:glycosyltransferase involved in cell wall biosynthesis
MVGTVEPRKGHAQALEAFEQLWREGHQCQLVIVGKSGWNVEKLILKIAQHKNLGMRLFLLEGISDEYLSLIYENATCLLVAAEGEGFGLPLIEGAQHGLPLLVRNIPIFREVAEDNAEYFCAQNSLQLSYSIAMWMQKFHRNLHIKSERLNYRSWTRCVEECISFITI